MKLDIFAEQQAKEKLTAKLDQSLLSHAKALSAADNPQIVEVYGLQALAELHCYLKTVHQFDSAEVEALLQFDDPLWAASVCWEENSNEYSFPICDLLRETKAKERLPLAEPEPPKKLSLREQLRSAIKEARQQSPEERPKGGSGGTAQGRRGPLMPLAAACEEGGRSPCRMKCGINPSLWQSE